VARRTNSEETTKPDSSFINFANIFPLLGDLNLLGEIWK